MLIRYLFNKCGWFGHISSQETDQQLHKPVTIIIMKLR